MIDIHTQRRHLSLRDTVLLAYYHLRMLHWWLYLLMGLGFLGACVLYWMMVRINTYQGIANGNEISRFVMESGVGLIAGALTSFLIIGDPMTELESTTRSGMSRVFIWRYLLTLGIMLLCALIYIGWTLHFGASYTSQQNIVFFISLSFVPVLLLSMLALLGAILTRSATIGALIPGVLLIGNLFLHDEMLSTTWLRPFFIPFAIWDYDSSDWWNNRITLLIIGLVLACLCGWLLTHREDKLLGSQQ
jgi:hypothetical protein